MHPYLTQSGRLVLTSGVLSLLAGLLLSDPLVMLVGQAHLVLLVGAFYLIAPAALVLDRRLVRVQVDLGEHGVPGSGHVVGTSVDLFVKLTNDSDQLLHNFSAEPFASPALRIDSSDFGSVVPPGGSARSEVKVAADSTGRWMLHGFDVSVTDPTGLVQTRDYLPSNHAFEYYPAAGRLRRRVPADLRRATLSGGAHITKELGIGTEIRQLRDYRPGDSLRDIAWKPSARARKLISREFEREAIAGVYVALDVSSSMRGGQWARQKLEFGVQQTVDILEEVTAKRDRFGLLTFDEKLYGHIAPGSSAQHYRRVLHHLVGLATVADAEMTELDDAEVEQLAADYLLIQERLDFRTANEQGVRTVNRELLNRWLKLVGDQTRQTFASGALTEGVIAHEIDAVREFLRLRGVELPYRVEARLGMKERGINEALRHIIDTSRTPYRVVLISDMCGILNVDSVLRALRAVQADGHAIEVLVPFTPWFYEPRDDDHRYEVIRELFTSSEADERQKVLERLRAAGIRTRVVGPTGTRA